MMHTSRLRLASALVVSVLALAACSGDDGATVRDLGSDDSSARPEMLTASSATHTMPNLISVSISPASTRDATPAVSRSSTTASGVMMPSILEPSP